MYDDESDAKNMHGPIKSVEFPHLLMIILLSRSSFKSLFITDRTFIIKSVFLDGLNPPLRLLVFLPRRFVL